MNKKGEDISFETVIFIILNLTFFAILLTFVVRSSHGAAIYEQSYAKEIALLIDAGKPGMSISVNVHTLVDVARSNGGTADKLIVLDKNNNVKVSASKSGGYGFQYFSGYDVSIARQPDFSSDNPVIIFQIGEKK